MKRIFKFLLNHKTITNLVIVLMLVTMVLVSATNLKTVSTKADSRVVYSGNTNNNNVCFMINVYEGNEYVFNMLDVLDVYSVKTTFLSSVLISQEVYFLSFHAFF